MRFFSIISSINVDFVPLPARSVDHQYLVVPPLSARAFLDLDCQAVSPLIYRGTSRQAAELRGVFVLTRRTSVHSVHGELFRGNRLADRKAIGDERSKNSECDEIRAGSWLIISNSFEIPWTSGL
jgi:hypothetical protein